jgi:hypothetical protein
MSRQNKSKINFLIKNWAKNTVSVYPWLKEHGVNRKLAQKYIISGWLERVGRGAFKRAGEEVDWTGAVYAIQTQMKKTVHPAGKTALQLLGRAQYIPAAFKERKVVLFGLQNEKLPAWFKKHNWGVRIHYVMSGLFGDSTDLGMTSYDTGNYEVNISAAERATLEFCYDVPAKESFKELYEIMSSLTTLRPHLVQKLLEECNSIKTKRIFMYLAEKNEHTWARRIDLAKVDLGKGKRALCKNGRYDPKYRIVVPK